MAYLDDLITARDTLAAAIKDNAGKPDYSIDGQSVSWTSIISQLEALERQIAAAEGPTEEIIHGTI